MLCYRKQIATWDCCLASSLILWSDGDKAAESPGVRQSKPLIYGAVAHYIFHRVDFLYTSVVIFYYAILLYSRQWGECANF